MKMRFRIMIILCIGLLLASCQAGSGNPKLIQADLSRIVAPEISDAQLAELRDGNNSFSFDLYHQLSLNNTDNLIYSPYSIWLAFSMVYGGAQGETETQMAQVFHFLDQGRQHVTLNAIDQKLQASGVSESEAEEGTPFQLNLANAVWSQQDYSFKSSFLDLMAMQYGAGVRVVDFQRASEEARQSINAWVSENTAGKIKEIAGHGSISPETRLV